MGVRERVLVRRLLDQINEWKEAGYVLAPRLLNRFLYGRGRFLDIDESNFPEATEEVAKESAPLIRFVIEKAFYSGIGKAYAKEPRIDRNKVTIDYANLEVRWESKDLIGWGDGWLQDRNKIDYMGDSNALFAAFGGARLELHGRVTQWREKANGRIRYSVKAKVILTDDYTFEPTGRIGQRLFFPNYAAAHELQVDFPIKYRRFNDRVTFTMTYRALDGRD
jgi:hypothetical protein